MKDITFIGQIDSTYGRGKDKQKRKRKALLTGAGITALGAGVGGALNSRKYERIFTGAMYDGYFNKKNPTNANINAVRKNFQKYKLGQGSAKADVAKKLFDKTSRKAGIRGAVYAGAVTLGAVGVANMYKKWKNQKIVKIGGKTLFINKPD